MIKTVDAKIIDSIKCHLKLNEEGVRKLEELKLRYESDGNKNAVYRICSLYRLSLYEERRCKMATFDIEIAAKNAFMAYCGSVKGVNVRGEKIPQWEDVGDNVKKAWISAVDDVVRYYQAFLSEG